MLKIKPGSWNVGHWSALLHCWKFHLMVVLHWDSYSWQLYCCWSVLVYSFTSIRANMCLLYFGSASRWRQLRWRVQRWVAVRSVYCPSRLLLQHITSSTPFRYLLSSQRPCTFPILLTNTQRVQEFEYTRTAFLLCLSTYFPVRRCCVSLV